MTDSRDSKLRVNKLNLAFSLVSEKLDELVLRAAQENKPANIDEIAKHTDPLCKIADSLREHEQHIENCKKEAEARRRNTPWMQAKKERFKRNF